MRTFILKALSLIYLKDLASFCFHKTVFLLRKFMGIDRKIMKVYFNNHRIFKLNVGCGENILKGWLNSDYYSKNSKIFQLDATKSLPFKSNVFHFVFCEHMIEHFPYFIGERFLSEVKRILKSNGKVRIATPNLRFLIDLFKSDKSKLQEKYISWATKMFIKDVPLEHETFVINNFVRAWGHQFIYDEKTLRLSMEQAGFSEITRCELNTSEDNELKNLENVNRMPDGFLNLETLILEGSKP